MTEADALQIGRTAVLEAKQAVGSEPQVWFAEIVRRAAEDVRIAEAFAVAGFLDVQASQAEKQ